MKQQPPVAQHLSNKLADAPPRPDTASPNPNYPTSSSLYSTMLPQQFAARLRAFARTNCKAIALECKKKPREAYLQITSESSITAREVIWQYTERNA